MACAGGNEYGFSRTYEPLSAEEPYFEQGRSHTYEDVRRNPGEFQQQLVAWFGTVDEVRGSDSQLKLALTLRYHQPRHQCSSESDSSCRVTVAPREGGPFSVLVSVRPEDRQGRNRIAPGSLLKVYGYATPDYDERGGPLMRAVFYRHFPAGTYVFAGLNDRMRR